MTLSCVYMVISCNLFSVHPFHACSYMYLNHVFVVVVVVVVVVFVIVFV